MMPRCLSFRRRHVLLNFDALAHHVDAAGLFYFTHSLARMTRTAYAQRTRSNATA